MRETTFRFKEFVVQQARSGMKISTDACLFGAYAQPHNAQRILDIGTGTGLLALMLAQRCQAQIVAIEIDSEAAAEAQDNFLQSAWKERLTLINADVRTWTDVSELFDYIICNPPFYTHASVPQSYRKTTAHHQNFLSFEALAQVLQGLLKPQAYTEVLLPTAEMQIFLKEAAKKGLMLSKNLVVRNFKEAPVFREIATMQKTNTPLVVQRTELVIYNAKDEYSTDFKNLLRPYYLHL